MGFPKKPVDVTNKSLSVEKVIIYIHNKIPGVEEEVLCNAMKNCTACSQMHSLQRNACFTLCSTDET
jgi:hypothetical protein